MKQMYFLTVVVNLWVGFWFVIPWLSRKYSFFSDLKNLIDRIPLQSRMGFSIFLLALGLVKMLFFSYGVLIIGDFFPSITLIFSSVVLLSEVLNERPETLPLSPKVMGIIEKIQNKQLLIGFLCLASATGHFLLADIVFF